MEPQVSKVLKIQRLRTRGETIMKTDKINMVINLSILALLIYLAVSVKTIQDKVFPDPNIMIPMNMGYDNSAELKYNIQELLNNVLKDAINQQEKN
jgi:hypothetical protein